MNDDTGETIPPERVPLGTAGLMVTRLGLGAGRLHTHDMAQPVTRTQAIDTIHSALAAGVRYFDTAPRYGEGESEDTLGTALEHHPAAAETVVATKVGGYPADFDYTARATIASVRESLTRLRRHTIDLVQAHELKPDTVDKALASGGVADGLAELKDRGLVRHIGFTTSTVECAIRALESNVFDTAMLWRKADILDDRLITAASPIARRYGVPIIVAAPFAAGLLLTGSEKTGARRRHPSPPTMARLDSLRVLSRQYHVELEALALQFALGHPGVGATVVGAHEPGHVRQQLHWLREPLPAALWEDVLCLRAGWDHDPATRLLSGRA